MPHSTKIALARGGGGVRYYGRCHACRWAGDLRSSRDAAQRDADAHENETRS